MISRRVLFLIRFSRLITRAKDELNLDLIIFWLNRTDEQQAALYAIGRTIELHRKPVTNCNGITSRSNHQYWTAGDLGIIKNGTIVWERIPEYEELGRIAKEEGLRWGGDWDGDEIRDPNDYDPYHFELKEES